jgi:hypothetical protein
LVFLDTARRRRHKEDREVCHHRNTSNNDTRMVMVMVHPRLLPAAVKDKEEKIIKKLAVVVKVPVAML